MDNLETQKGLKIKLKNANLYLTAYSESILKKLTGTFYMVDGKLFNDRYRITDQKSKITNNDPKACIGYIHKNSKNRQDN